MLCLHPKETLLKPEFRIKVGMGLTWPGLSVAGVTLVSEVSLGPTQAFDCLVCSWEGVYC